MPDHPVEPIRFSRTACEFRSILDDENSLVFGRWWFAKRGPLYFLSRLAISILIIAGVFVFLGSDHMNESAEPFLSFSLRSDRSFSPLVVVSIFLPQVLQRDAHVLGLRFRRCRTLSWGRNRGCPSKRIESPDPMGNQTKTCG